MYFETHRDRCHMHSTMTERHVTAGDNCLCNDLLSSGREMRLHLECADSIGEH